MNVFIFKSYLIIHSDTRSVANQLDHMQIICTTFQTNNHVSTSSRNVYRSSALLDAEPTAWKLWRHLVSLRLLSSHWSSQEGQHPLTGQRAANGWWLVGKPVYDFLFVIIELFSLPLTIEALQGKTCQDSLLSGEGRSVSAKISGAGVVPPEYFLVYTKLYTFCYLTVQTAPCYVPSFWHNTNVWQTDGRTDRRKCRS